MAYASDRKCYPMQIAEVKISSTYNVKIIGRSRRECPIPLPAITSLNS